MNSSKKVHVIFPRRKQHSSGLGAPVELTLDFLKPYFTKPLTQVCEELGISATAIKKACRRFGVSKWPFRTLTAKTSRNRDKVMAWEVEGGVQTSQGSDNTNQLPATRAVDAAIDISTQIKIESNQHRMNPLWFGEVGTPCSELDSNSDSNDEFDEIEHVSSPLLEAPAVCHGIVHVAAPIECNGFTWEHPRVAVEQWGLASPFHFPEDSPLEWCASDLWSLNIG